MLISIKYNRTMVSSIITDKITFIISVMLLIITSIIFLLSSYGDFQFKVIYVFHAICITVLLLFSNNLSFHNVLFSVQTISALGLLSNSLPLFLWILFWVSSISTLIDFPNIFYSVLWFHICIKLYVLLQICYSLCVSRSK